MCFFPLKTMDRHEWQRIIRAVYRFMRFKAKRDAKDV